MLGGLRQKFVLYQSWQLELRSGSWQCRFLLKVQRRICGMSLCELPGAGTDSGIPWLAATSLRLCLCILRQYHLCLCVPVSSGDVLRRTPVTGFGYCRCSVAKSFPNLCHSMNCSTPGFPSLQYLWGFVQTHVH